jgi:ketosteroid isomerase-like protein
MSDEMSKAHEQFIRDFMGSISAQGFRVAIKKFVSPNVVWWVTGAGEIQDKLDAIAEMFERTLENGLGFKMTILDMISQDNKVAAEVQGCGKLTDGATYNNFYHFLFEIRDGKIARVREYLDTKHVDQIYGHYVAQFL